MKFFSALIGKRSGPRLYKFTSPRPSADLGAWAPHFPNHREVVGHSSLGHFFLRNPDDLDYLVLHPFKRAAKSYGSHSSIEGFESSVLKDPGFQALVLRPVHVAEIFKQIGALAEGQVYIPNPYPFLGGSEAPETYDRGDALVFMHVVAHVHGLNEQN